MRARFSETHVYYIGPPHTAPCRACEGLLRVCAAGTSDGCVLLYLGDSVPAARALNTQYLHNMGWAKASVATKKAVIKRAAIQP